MRITFFEVKKNVMQTISKMFRNLAAGLSLLLLTFVLIPGGLAQETTAAIQGTVKDSTGAVVAGATVTASSDALIKPLEVTTDKGGYYRLNALRPGTYVITVNGSGMRAKATDVRISAGDLPTLNLTVSAGAETIIDVNASVAMVDVTQSKVETTITNEILQQIPKGRSFQSVIPFAPGARQEPLQSVTAGVVAGGRQNGFQIDGASDGENTYLIEGLNVTNIVGGGSGTGAGGLGGFNVPFEFVKDVQVKSSSFEAEFGGAIGGVINVISQQGSSNWHGSFFTYYRSSALSANDQCAFTYTTACGLRLDPLTPANAATRTDGPAQYYIAKQDHYKILEPGFTIGGPLLKNHIFFFASYAPQFYRQRRNVNFNPTNPSLAGPRDFYTTQDTHYGFSRIDYAPFSKLRLFAAWEDSYARVAGNSLPNPDSKIGQRNSSSTTDPTTFRQDSGTVNPSSLYLFGADYTVTSRLLASVRYGYTYANSGDRGKPIGTRYVYTTNSVTATSKGLDGTQIPAAFQQPVGFNNIASNFQSIYNILSRKQLNLDLSYTASHLLGTHSFKTGYQLGRVKNDILSGYKTAEVDLYYGLDYTPVTSSSACNAVISANNANATYAGSGYAGTCRGTYGYFVVHDGVDSSGTAVGENSAFYFQDQWTVGRTGLTINAGVRFDKEYLPPYNPGASSISFGYTNKVAPRLGAAYDVLHNGKLKVYASYGQFYDITKFSLPSGSFGGQYWHDCVYALDSFDYNTITPSAPGSHGCPTSGAAPGVTAGRFVENVDFRKNVINTVDPGVDPNVAPMKQHEFVTGAEWAITPSLSFTTRYARKRLDNTIEDIGVTDNLGFYIGNPGPGYGDLLHRALPGSGITAPLCTACPIQPKAIREYDGLEFRVTKTASHYFVSAFYTYSKLSGNYPGLTSTFTSDGAGGRQSPNNNRSFDSPQQQFDAHGNVVNGRLPTDRPNTFSAFGSVRGKSRLGESQLGLSQAIYQGTPVSTCWPAGSSTSACQFVEQQGNWVNLARAADGTISATSITHDRRTPAYLQTSGTLSHYIHLSKDHEERRLGAEFNVINILNQHAVTSLYNIALTTATYPNQASTAANPTGFNFLPLLTGWDYVGISNNGVPGQTTNNGNKTISNRYGQPNLFQNGRQIRIQIAYKF